jgi:tetratricopeptide (TPR) repeat protein
MKKNDSVDRTAPSDIVVSQIFDISEYCTGFWDSLNDLKKKIEHTHDEKILLELNNKMRLYMKQLSKLKECMEYIHETFRTIPLRSKRLQEAEAYFYQGKFREMDEVLDTSKIREGIEQLKEDRFSEDEDREKEVRFLLECKSYEMIVKALFHYTFIENPHWYEEVFDLLKEAEDISVNIHAMYELACYLKDTEERDWAFQLLRDASDIYEEDESEACRLYRAKCFWAMGILSKNKNDHSAAVEYFGQAVKIYSDLSETNPAEYRSRTANMLVLLGTHHAAYLQNFPVALVVFEEAVKIRREQALHGNWERHMNLANVLVHLANVHGCMKEYGEAVALYEEALRIQENNIDQNIYMILEEKANTLQNLAEVYAAAGEYEKAIRKAEEELQARKEVQDVDPFGQLPRMAGTRKLMSDLYLSMKRSNEAIREKEKEVKLYKTLVKHLPNEYLLSLGEALNTASNLYHHEKLYGKYFLTTMEAVELFRKLAETDPDNYRVTVAYLLGNVCHYYEHTSPNKKKAFEYARETYEILSTIERDETGEILYNVVKRIIEKG